MKALVVGYGSIGARHARLLAELGHSTAVVSARVVDFPLVYADLNSAVAAENPDYVVVANATSQHHETLVTLARSGYNGTVLVEKPVFHRSLQMPSNAFQETYVAYNLRFHPIIQKLKSLLKETRILSAQAYVGQYLPDWRPMADYRTSYSACANQGGGALRDLSHELDYLMWMLGDWERVAAIGGHVSPLEITSDDLFGLLLVTRHCPMVALQLNYLDRVGRRHIVINTGDSTIEADLIKGVIRLDGAEQTYVTERDHTYREMHRAILSGKAETVCSLHQGLEINRLIESAEHAAKNHEWVKR